MSTFPSDIEIAQNATMSHIKDIANKINISEDDLEKANCSLCKG